VNEIVIESRSERDEEERERTRGTERLRRPRLYLSINETELREDRETHTTQGIVEAELTTQQPTETDQQHHNTTTTIIIIIIVCICVV
jgi:hypothetical protein